MIINGKNYLLLERRGCEYIGEDVGHDDVGNHRVCTPCACITGKNSRRYFLECGWWRARDCMHLTAQWEDDNGWHGDLATDKALAKGYPAYSCAEILRAANALSATPYDDIKWVWTFEEVVPSGSNFTPGTLIRNFAKRNRLQLSDVGGGTRLHMYNGAYKYLAYDVTPGKDRDTVRVYLERV